MNLKANFTLTQLEYVLAVYRLGHFAKAAEACQVTQPTLSMQIQKLEESFGVTIFDRSKKPILLTDVGKKLVEQMQAVLSESKKIDAILDSAKSSDGIRGEVTLGVIPTIAPYVLPRLLPVLDTSFPALSIRIRELQTHRILDCLQNDEIDVGLLATPVKMPRIFEYALYYEPFSILCQKRHELSRQKSVNYKDLKSDDIWLLEEGHCMRHQMMDICSLKKNARGARKYVFESGSIETIKSIVNTFGGYTLVPAMATEAIGANSLLIDFERPIPAREVGLVYRREHHKIALIEALGEAIVQCIPEKLRSIRKKDLDVLPIDG